jgi:hypothetical protein
VKFNAEPYAGEVEPAIIPGTGSVELTVIARELAGVVVHVLPAVMEMFPFTAVQP